MWSSSSENYIWKCVISDLYLFWKLVIWKSLVSKICCTENWLFWKSEYLKIVCFEDSFSKINVLKNNDPKIDYTEKSVHPCKAWKNCQNLLIKKKLGMKYVLSSNIYSFNNFTIKILFSPKRFRISSDYMWFAVWIYLYIVKPINLTNL